MDRIDSDPVFKEDRVCQLLILEALKHHLMPERLPVFGVHGAFGSGQPSCPVSKPRKSTVGALYAVGCVESGAKGDKKISFYHPH